MSDHPKTLEIYFNRPPRIRPDLPSIEIEIPGPPELEEVDISNSWISTMLPLVVRVLPMALLGISFAITGVGTGIYLVVRLLMFPLIIVISFLAAHWFDKGEQRRRERAEQKRNDILNNHRKLLQRIRREEIERFHDEQRSILARSNPSPKQLLDRLPVMTSGRVEFPDHRLWERRTDDDDFLVIRAGIGQQPSLATILYPDRLQYIIDYQEKEELLNQAISMGQRYQVIDSAPLLINLPQRGIVSIVGDESRYDVLRSMIMQVVIHHAPDDVGLYVIAPDDKQREKGDVNSERWAWANALPHCNSNLRGGRGDLVARDIDSAYQLLERLQKLLNRRREKLIEGGQFEEGRQFLILIVDDYDQFIELQSHPIFSNIFEMATQLGIAAIFNHENVSNVPSQVTGLLRLDMPEVGLWYGETGLGGKRVPDVGWDIEDTIIPANKNESGIWYNDPDWKKVKAGSSMPDLCDQNLLADTAHILRNIRLKKTGTAGDIPPYVGFLRLYGEDIYSIDDLQLATRWSQRPDKGKLPFKVPIGMKASGKLQWFHLLDGEDGPHGLVAGTTGSGKSEFLQTLILALAIEHHPHFLSFFLVDYKGGSSFSVFDRLPHTVGVISDLKPDEAERALIALRSEMRFRKQIFAETGEQLNSKVNDLAKYHELYMENERQLQRGEKVVTLRPIPHLVIIIDEFAELRAELHHFMPEMTRIARVGRSLGIHLILATQRPAGTVSEDVRANSQFKICLRVQSPVDSRDMIDSPDAAFLPSIAGRGYIKSGNQSAELFQAGYAGDTYDPNQLLGAKTDVNTSEDQFTIYWSKSGEESVSSYTYTSHKSISEPKSKQTELQDRYVDENVDQRRVSTVIEAMINHLESEGKLLNLQLPQLWQPPLPSDIQLNELLVRRQRSNLNAHQMVKFEEVDDQFTSEWRWESKYWENSLIDFSMVLGVLDDPAQRRQDILEVNLSDPQERSHLLIYGASSTGKTTTLRTIMLSLVQFHPPSELHLYILDFGVGKALNSLGNYPHIGAYVDPSEDASVRRVLRWFGQEYRRRRSEKIGDWYTHNRTAYANGNEKAILPALFLVIDNFSEFRDQISLTAEGGKRPEVPELDILRQIAQDGTQLGIFILATAGNKMSDIPNFITRSIDKRLAFRMNESDQLQMVIGGRYKGDISILPVGRGLWRGSPPLQLQVAIAGQSLDIQSNLHMLQQLGDEMREATQNNPTFSINQPYQVGNLPDTVDLMKLVTDEFIDITRSTSSLSVILGQREDNLKSYITVLGEEAEHGLILGRRKSGRTTLLQTFALSAACMYPAERLRIILIAPDRVIIDQNRPSLAQLDGLPHNPYPHVVQTPEQLKSLLQDLGDEFQRRFQEPNVDYPQVMILIDDAKQIFEATEMVKSLGAGVNTGNSEMPVTPSRRRRLLAQQEADSLSKPDHNGLSFAALKDGFNPDWAKWGAQLGMYFVVGYQFNKNMLRFQSPFLEQLKDVAIVMLTNHHKAQALGVNVLSYRELRRKVDLDVRGRGLAFVEGDTPDVIQFATPNDNINQIIEHIQQRWSS